MNQYYLDIINEETPCDGCVHASDCGMYRKACMAFALYVNTGDVDWTMPRAPTKRLYKRTMWFFTSAFTKEINQLRKELAS